MLLASRSTRARVWAASAPGRDVEDVAEDAVLGQDEDDGFGGDVMEVLADLFAHFLRRGEALERGVDDPRGDHARASAGDGGDEDAGLLGAGLDDGEMARRQAEQVGEVDGWERGRHETKVIVPARARRIG
jgi:hypothetical protein